MEFALKGIEVAATAEDATYAELRELDELQMALIGGGSGDPVAY
jgi:hypothetical protein